MSSPLSERVVEVRALAQVLWFLPPPARTELADKLHGLGVRVHPELATLELVREGPKAMGNHAPQRPVKRTVAAQGMDILRQVNPELAARIDAVASEQERLDLLAELKAKIPDDLGQIDERLAGLRPEDLE